MNRSRKGANSAAILATLLLAAAGMAQNRPGVAKSNAPDSPADPVVTAKAIPPGYTIGEQDVLNVDVWQEKEMSGPVVVRPDGMITVPLVNDVYVVGMTPEHLAELLTTKLKPFLEVPQVTVTVSQINSRRVYVIGEVARRGMFQINSTTTVLQILAQAGGISEYANGKKIYILRTVKGKQVRLPFNYDAVIRGSDDKDNIILRPGDTVVVP